MWLSPPPFGSRVLLLADPGRVRECRYFVNRGLVVKAMPVYHAFFNDIWCSGWGFGDIGWRGDWCGDTCHWVGAMVIGVTRPPLQAQAAGAAGEAFAPGKNFGGFS